MDFGMGWEWLDYGWTAGWDRSVRREGGMGWGGIGGQRDLLSYYVRKVQVTTARKLTATATRHIATATQDSDTHY